MLMRRAFSSSPGLRRKQQQEAFDAVTGPSKPPLVLEEPTLLVKVLGLCVGMLAGESAVSYWALGKLPQFNDADFRSGLPPK